MPYSPGMEGPMILRKLKKIHHLLSSLTIKLKKINLLRTPTTALYVLLIAQKEEAGIQLQAEEFDLMAAAADLDEIEEVNANCILMANLQQASTSAKAALFDKVSEPVDTTKERCTNTKVANQSPRRKPSLQACYSNLFYGASLGCSKQDRNLKLPINFVWNFLGTVRFGNDHIAAILGYGDLQWGNILISRTSLFPPVSKEKAKGHLTHPNQFQILRRGYTSCLGLCGPMRIASINGKRYVLVIVDDYSRYTWVHFLRSKDEAPKVIKTFLKRITVLLQSPVIIIRTDNGTEFKNQILKEYFDSVGISHQTVLLSEHLTKWSSGTKKSTSRLSR
ncbi:integrase, catalytic region, zinc finger, CCHC-type containing protein [Tanacetum coccineum]